jgi:amino acid transporter
MAVDAPFVLISIASMIFFLIYLLMFVDLWILRRKQADANKPFYAGGAKKVPNISIFGIIFILGVLIGKAMEAPKIIPIVLPVVAECPIFCVVFNTVRKKKAT